jgi:hypothetical protein
MSHAPLLRPPVAAAAGAHDACVFSAQVVPPPAARLRLQQASALLALVWLQPVCRSSTTFCHFLVPARVCSLAAELKAGSSLFPDVAAGIYVPYVQPGGPADRAGLVSGDVITGARGITYAVFPIAVCGKQASKQHVMIILL